MLGWQPLCAGFSPGSCEHRRDDLHSATAAVGAGDRLHPKVGVGQRLHDQRPGMRLMFVAEGSCHAGVPVRYSLSVGAPIDGPIPTPFRNTLLRVVIR